MRRLTMEDSIFPDSITMVKSVLNIFENYEVYNISVKLISRAYTAWHKQPYIKIENDFLVIISECEKLQTYMPLNLIEEITIRYKDETEYYKFKYEDTLRVTTRYLDNLLNPSILELINTYDK